MSCQNEISNAYAAGIIDGEGTITLTRETKWRYPVVSVSSTTPAILDFLSKEFGGSICKQKSSKPHHRQCWSWRVVGAAAISMLERTRGFLLEPEKLRRANLIVERYKEVTQRNGKYTPEQTALKQSFEDVFFSKVVDLGEIESPS